MTLIAWTGGKRDKLAEVFQNQLAEVGIKAKIEIMDIGTMNARVRQENEKSTGVGTMDMMTWSWYDPDILYALWHSPGAYRGYTSPELDAMLEKTRVLTNEDERKKAVQDVMALPPRECDPRPALHAGLGVGVRRPSGGQGLQGGAVRLPDLQRREVLKHDSSGRCRGATRRIVRAKLATGVDPCGPSSASASRWACSRCFVTTDRRHRC